MAQATPSFYSLTDILNGQMHEGLPSKCDRSRVDRLLAGTGVEAMLAV